jgi:hypothetical protein
MHRKASGGVDDLAAARAARDAAVAREQAALADLRAAGILARLAIEEMDGTLGDIARKNRLPASALSKLNPRKGDGAWEPLRIDSYQMIDHITGGQYELVKLRQVFDEAKQLVKRAETAVSLADARTDKAHATRTAMAGTRAQDGPVVIDDVLVDRRSDRVVLDIRVRNAGDRAADITRAAVRVLTRAEFLTAYPVTAHYDLRVDGDYSETGIAHLVKPDDVDRFTLALGFAQRELGCVFTAELVLRFNGDHTAVSTPFTFDSCFE